MQALFCGPAQIKLIYISVLQVLCFMAHGS